MVTSRQTAGLVRAVTPRRRGAVLERAILDAALEQLSTVGWSGLTMEGVAALAQTGKAAVYRRWSCSRCAARPGTRCSRGLASRCDK